MEVANILSNPAVLAGADRDAAKLVDNFETFLTLLTAQLQNQDPLEPLSSNEFTQQLVQFTGVEQAITTNKNLEQLLTLIQATQSASAVGYLGQMAEWEGNTAQLADGGATWGYQIDGAAQAATISIENAAGTIVYTGSASTKSGRQEFAWDGTDGSGNTLPDGAYTFNVSALGADSQLLGVTTWTSGVIDGVRNDPTGTVLTVGKTDVPFGDVRRVFIPTEATASALDINDTLPEMAGR